MSRPPTVWFSFSQAALSGQPGSEGRTREPGDGDGEAAPADPVNCGHKMDKHGSEERRLRKDFRVMGELQDRKSHAKTQRRKEEPRMNANKKTTRRPEILRGEMNAALRG